MKRLSLFLLFIAVQSSLCGMEDAPWFRRYLLPYVTAGVNYQTYEKIAVDSHPQDHWGSGFEEYLSLYLSPLSQWCVEIEAITVDDRDRSFGFDSAKITGRYLVLSDIEGDPISLALGLSFAGVSGMGLRDRSMFHQGKEEYEFHVAVGKEVTCGPIWDWHTWGVVGVGIADRGSPWVWGKVTLAKQLQEWASWSLFVSSRANFGNHKMNLEGRFHGYGALRQNSVDVGGSFIYRLYCGEIELVYQWRPWGRNCPVNDHQVALSYILPWSL